MSALTDLRRLMSPGAEADNTSGVVVGVEAVGSILVRTRKRTLSCTTVVPLVVGDRVRLQGSLVVSKQTSQTESLPEYRV